MSTSNLNNAYRRGVILGLTLAEIMLLVLFVLLLSFASLLERNEKKCEQEKQLLSKNNKNIVKIVSVLAKNDPAIMDELVETFEVLPTVTMLIKKENLKKSEGETTKQVIMRAVEKLSANKALDSTNGKLTIEGKLEEATKENADLKSKAVSLESEIANVQGRNKNLLSQLKSNGKGADYPHCWQNPNGKAEFIYDITLSNNGISIHDNQISHRQHEQAQLPIHQVTYDKPISREQFGNQINALSKWAVNQDCRFSVRIIDKTDSNQKDLYISLLNTVENSFYKYLMKKNG